MELGDFFRSAPYQRPVNPKVIKFTATCSESTLPGGQSNPGRQLVSATITAAMVFVSSEDAQKARIDARQSLQKRFVDGDKNPLFMDDADLSFETLCHELWRILHEWDENEKMVGEKLFPAPDTIRQLLTPAEMRRIYKLYSEYHDVEHKEALDKETFREAEEPSPRVAIAASR